MTVRPSGLVLGALALAAVLAGCGGGSATLGAAIPAVGGAPRPEPVITAKVGECRALDDAAMSAQNDNHPAVSCSADHTAVTYYVGDLHGDPTDFNSTTLDDCQAQFDRAVGLSTNETALTIVSAAFFLPSSREYALGARQFRCDLVANATYDGVPQPLPAGSRVPLLDSVEDVPDSLRLCQNAAERDVPCTRPHVYRASGAFQASGGTTTLPSRTYFRAQARAGCPPLVSTRRYLFRSPSKNGWEEDDERTILCWSKVTD